MPVKLGQMPRKERIFLSAEWRDLAILNYEVDPRLLDRYVPPGTVLDSFQEKTYASLVGFRFCRTRLFGFLPVPFHSNFVEVNLRFYVRRRERGEIRRGVVFIAEIVPRRAVAIAARLSYGENYFRLPMKHSVSAGESEMAAAYRWQLNGQWCGLAAQARGIPAQPAEGSFEQFIAEHYWGYSARRNGSGLEYRVSHAPWAIWTNTDAKFTGDASALYGVELGRILERPPHSAFLAAGSPVIVYKGEEVR